MEEALIGAAPVIVGALLGLGGAYIGYRGSLRVTRITQHREDARQRRRLRLEKIEEICRLLDQARAEFSEIAGRASDSRDHGSEFPAGMHTAPLTQVQTLVRLYAPQASDQLGELRTAQRTLDRSLFNLYEFGAQMDALEEILESTSGSLQAAHCLEEKVIAIGRVAMEEPEPHGKT